MPFPQLEKGRILTALVSLRYGDEVMTMVEKLLQLETTHYWTRPTCGGFGGR